MQLPLTQEQLVTTHLTVTMGAALAAAPNQVPQVISQLNAAIDNSALREQAVKFAGNREHPPADESQERIAETIDAACRASS